MSPNQMGLSAIAPPAPACFDSRVIWLAFLSGAQIDKYNRPFDAQGQYQRSFSFCVECTAQHAAQMRQQGRCVKAARPLQVEAA